MKITRRRLFYSLAVTAGGSAAVEGAEPGISLEVLRDVSAYHGTNLSDDRLRVVRPVLEHRLAELRTLRDFRVDADIEPTQGILDK